ncbi:hypothetical protein E2P81_ATG03861 [Venturia nashicola]|uniref:chitinase n=1 Tax=Venturia nashicola TaxID=86259 RepID=A0A4Z1PEZ2_9PEZI|nr:hypothetical protein E6O75_ATG03952 [Venturia nashicola]TLD38186.1 hypothetical protein E2P81_ATG03861 [Venturia nashicola]
MIHVLSVFTYFSLAFSSVARAKSVAPRYDVEPLGNGTFESLPTLKEKDGYRAVAYYVNWAIYGRNHPPSEIPVQKLNYILYAFANVDNKTGAVYLSDTFADVEKMFPGDVAQNGTNMYGCLKQINLLKRKNRNLKVLLSIGGWTYGPNFAPPMATEAGRKTFAKTSVQLLKDHGFDGLDVDWEFPTTTQQGQDWVNVMKETRAELDAYEKKLGEQFANVAASAFELPKKRPHFYLTIAAPAGPLKYNLLDPKGMEPYMDFVNLMAYDYSGSWDNHTGHNANLYPSKKNKISTPFNTAQAVGFYVDKGIPSEKLVLGMPLYGRGFMGTQKTPGKAYANMSVGSWEAGVWDYKVLPRPGKPRIFHDPAIGASWSFDNSTREFVSYDTPRIAKQKAKYIRKKRLGGGMWWETSYDKNGTESLISTVRNELTKGRGVMEVKLNNLDYPDSKYDNLRNGFK